MLRDFRRTIGAVAAASLSASAAVWAADVTRFIPVELASGLGDGVLLAMVMFFALCGWIMGKFHEAVLWRVGDAVAKARIVQGLVASFIAAIFGFWTATPYLHYPLLVGCGAATLMAYLGVRAIEVVGQLGLEGLRAFFAGKAPPSAP